MPLQYKLILIALCATVLSIGSGYTGFRLGVASEVAAQAEREAEAKRDKEAREQRLKNVETRAAELLGPQKTQQERVVVKEVVKYAIKYRDRPVDCAERDAERLRILNEAYGVGGGAKLPSPADGSTGAAPGGKPE